MSSSLRTSDGITLHLRRWAADESSRPAHGTVQIVHGLGEHTGRYEALAQRLNQAGWHVAGHDQRGHGLSTGPRGDMGQPQALLTDLSAVLDHLRGDGRHVLLGHSMGGLVAARFVAESLVGNARRWAREVDGLVLSSPALDPGLGLPQRVLLRLLKPLVPALRLGNGLQPEWISRDPEVVRAYTADPLVHDRVTPRLVRFMVDEGRLVRRRAARWRTPTLLMWAGADRCVAPAGSAAFAAAAPREVLTAQELPGLFHEIFNEPEREQVIQQLLQWLQRFQAQG
jgi:alpha-beta hydrolase superfamily lysophospholipase